MRFNTTSRTCSRRAALALFTLLLAFAPDAWATPITVGVMGDSLSDEYSEQTYGAYAQNWVQQLAQYDGVNFGRTAAAAGYATWGEPRRTGFEFNWARYGDTSDTLLSQGEHIGLAAQVAPNGIPYAVLAIGANDFFPGGPGSAYDTIYNGLATPAQINAYVAQRVANVTTALNAVLPTGVHLALVNFPDYGVTPYTSSVGYTNAARRQLVSNVIDGLNGQLQALAQADHLVYVDLKGFATTLFGSNASPHSTLTLGGINIALTGLSSVDSGANPTGGFVADGIHPNTTIQGMLADLVGTALNTGYHANIPLFSEQEILAHKGLAYGGADTLQGQIGPYSAYVTNFVVPEPSSLVLAACAAIGLLLVSRPIRAATKRFVVPLVCIGASILLWPLSASAEMKTYAFSGTYPIPGQFGPMHDLTGFDIDHPIAISGTVVVDTSHDLGASPLSMTVLFDTHLVAWTDPANDFVDAGFLPGNAIDGVLLRKQGPPDHAAEFNTNILVSHLEIVLGASHNINPVSPPDHPLALDDFPDLSSASFDGPKYIVFSMYGPNMGDPRNGAIISWTDSAAIDSFTQVPEPSSLVLAACGAIGLFVLGRRRRAQRLKRMSPSSFDNSRQGAR